MKRQNIVFNWRTVEILMWHLKFLGGLDPSRKSFFPSKHFFIFFNYLSFLVFSRIPDKFIVWTAKTSCQNIHHAAPAKCGQCSAHVVIHREICCFSTAQYTDLCRTVSTLVSNQDNVNIWFAPPPLVNSREKLPPKGNMYWNLKKTFLPYINVSYNVT